MSTVTTANKSERELRLEARNHTDAISALKNKGQDRTAEDTANLKKHTSALKEISAQLKEMTAEETFKSADEAIADIKTIYEPDRPDPSLGDSVASRNGNGTIRGNLVQRHIGAHKTLGEMVVGSEEYKTYNTNVKFSYGVDFSNISSLKATLTTATSTLTSFERPPGLFALGQQRLTIADLIPTGMTNVNTIRYAKEDTYTNAATTVTEGSAKPEASWDVSEVDAAVRKVAVWTKITDEMYNDFPVIQSYIDSRLRFMVESEEEDQLLNGDGNAPNLRGILQTSGIQTQAQGGDDPLVAVHKAITKIRSVAFFEPDGIVMHPTDYEIARLEADANGQFYGGGPFTGAYGQNGIPTQPGPWGLRPVVTTAIAAGTVLVGAFGLGAQIFRRQGVTISMTNTDQDDFIKNLITLRCEVRLALAVYRPLAFCTVTSFAAGA